MARLIYITNMSLDGYTEDMEGRFDWTTPSEEVFQFITDLVRVPGTYLYGRRMYQTMMLWETEPGLAVESPSRRDFAELWQAADKIVYSSTLETVSTRRTQLERNFDPAAIRQLKEAVDHDILIGGPGLAAQAFRSGLIDECQLFVAPVILGGGKPALADRVRLQLELLEERRFDNGTIFLRYRTKLEGTP
jgi:dihydrofolate reductase